MTKAVSKASPPLTIALAAGSALSATAACATVRHNVKLAIDGIGGELLGAIIANAASRSPSRCLEALGRRPYPLLDDTV